MTQPDPGWQALLQPYLAERLFDHAPPPLAADREFALHNAWWLANLCHAAYLWQAPAEPPPAGYRDDVLAARGFAEVEFIDEGAIQGVLATRGELCLLAFRGTDDPRDWLVNTRIEPVPWPGGGRVHDGFNEAFARIAPTLAALRARYAGQRWLVTGHSQGAAMAVLSAALLRPVSVYGFGCPRLGDAAFAAALEGEAIHQVVNGRDLICQLPPSLGDYETRLPGRIHHVGHPVGADDPVFDLKAFARRVTTPSDWALPVPELGDHAIVNYVASIERQLDR